MSVASRLWSLRKRRPLFVALSVLTLVTLFVYPAIDEWVRAIGAGQPMNYQDFSVYESAVARWQAGDALYVPNAEGGYHGSYLYPPVALLVFWPFTFLSHADAGLAWGVLTILLLWVALQLVVARLGVSLRWYERALGLWALVGFHPLFLSFKMGQTAAFQGALLAFALVGLLGTDRTQSMLSGAATAVVGVFKMAYAPVGAHLLADEDRFLGAVAVGVALVALSVLVAGLESNLQYVEVLTWGADRSSQARAPDLWLPPYFRQLHWLPGSIYARLGISAAVVAVALLARGVHREIFALGVATFLLVTPQPYAYYFVAALPAILVMIAVEFERDGYPAVPLAALLLLQIHSYGLGALSETVPWLFDALPPVLYAFTQPGFWGVLLLFGIAWTRVVREVEHPSTVLDRAVARGD